MARRRNRTCTADVKLPGSIYRNPPPDGGFYWAVRLPGEPRRRARPLVPAGGRTATKSQPVAIEVARALFERALADADASAAPADATGGLTVAALYRRFLTHARTYYRRSDGEPTSEVGIIRAGCQFLLAAAGTCQAADVGPEHLTAAVDAMIGANLARSTCNKYLDRIQRLFGWAEGPEAGHLVPQATAITVERFPKLSARRSRARETPPVRPVPAAYIERVLDAVDAPVADMIRVQLYTGMRSGELCILRPMDLDTAGKVWLYEPGHHKTAHVGGGERTSRKLVAIGPRALRILKARIKGCPVDRPVFAPYSPASYRRHITRAIAAANRQTRRRMETEAAESGAAMDADALARALLPRWTPHRLRHNAGTTIRRELSRDAARAVLGQRSLAATDTYAELDEALAVEAARKLG